MAGLSSNPVASALVTWRSRTRSNRAARGSRASKALVAAPALAAACSSEVVRPSDSTASRSPGMRRKAAPAAGAYAPAPETVSGGFGNVTGGAPGSFGNGGSTGLGAGARYGFDGYGGLRHETIGRYNPTTGTFSSGGLGGD